MEFTLRQARNLESRLRNLSIDNQVIEVRAYDSAVARADILSGVDTLGKEIDSKLELNDIRHEIKRLINIENMNCGVAERLNSRDCLYAKRDILNTLGSSDNVERQVSHISSSPKPMRMASVYNEELEESVEQDLADIDHELNEISRELNELNSTRTINLSDDDIATLTENGIL
ncbi:hypothetical protein VPHD148_0255 [Vibrio phage D148]